MVIQNTPTKIDKIASLRIGQRGENLATDIKMDVSDWITVHPDANYYCLFKRPDEVQVQPVLSSLEEDVLTWTVRAWECAVIGVGYLEVRAVNPDTGLVAKSRVIPCAIEDSVIDDEGPVPPEMSWVGEVLAAKDTAVAAKTAAEEARDTAQTTVNGAIAGIQAEGQTQVGVVQAEGTTQVGAVQSEGTTQVGAVQAKGTEVLNSIPSDYTALTGEVSGLKSAINVIDEQFPSINGVVLPPAFEVGLRYVNNGSDTWVTNNKRLTFKRGNYIKLKQGDTVTRDENVLLEFGGGYSTDNGSSFTAIDSRGAAYTVPTDGIYFFWMTKIDSSAFTSEDVENGWKYLSFTRSGSIVEDIDALESIRSENRLTSIDGTIVPPHYDIGVRYVSNGADVWGLNAKRMSFKKGTFISLKAGDKVSRNASFISEFGGGYSTDNGASFIAISGNTSTYSAPANGIYFFWTSKVGDTNFTDSDVENSFNALYFSREPNTVKTVENIKTNLDNLILVPVALSDGFYSDGGTIQAQTAGKEKYTQKYDVVAGMTLTVAIKYINSAHDMWIAACEWLNDGTFYRRTIVAITGTWGTETTYTPGSNVVTVAFSFRGFDDFDFSLSTSNIQFLAGGGAVVSDVKKISNRLNVVENIFRFKPFYSHLGVEQSTNIIIPCQSISDVLRAKRLGFDAIELNVQRTSDNKYMCLHGESGKFGPQFIGADSSDVSNIKVSDKTLDWIKANVRYVSKYSIYQTAPFTLEEMLYECKKLCVVPLVQYYDMTMVGIINKIMGVDNYVMLIYGNDRGNKTNAVCMSWTAIADVDEAIEKCNASGKPYILGVNHGNSAFSNFTNEDWEEYINAVHAAGYYIGGAYINASTAPTFRQLGWDVIGSTVQINEIENGNICNLFSDLEYTDFSTDGAVDDGVLALTVGERVTPNETYQDVFLGGGSLHIRFSGKVYVNMGKIGISYTSDGKSDVWFSTYFEEQEPTFTVSAAEEGAEIYELSYKASRM